MTDYLEKAVEAVKAEWFESSQRHGGDEDAVAADLVRAAEPFIAEHHRAELQTVEDERDLARAGAERLEGMIDQARADERARVEERLLAGLSKLESWADDYDGLAPGRVEEIITAALNPEPQPHDGADYPLGGAPVVLDDGADSYAEPNQGDQEPAPEPKGATE